MAKISAGKTTFKSLFSTGSKDDKILKLEKNIDEVHIIIHILIFKLNYFLKRRNMSLITAQHLLIW